MQRTEETYTYFRAQKTWMTQKNDGTVVECSTLFLEANGVLQASVTQRVEQPGHRRVRH